MIGDLILLKVACGGLFLVAAGLGGYVLLSRPESMVRRAYPLYVALLNRRLYRMLLPAVGSRIVMAQLSALALLALAIASLGDARLGAAVVLVLIAPMAVLHVMHVRRVGRIDEQVDSFLLMLANALRATPSLGSALAYTEALISAPLSKELTVTLHEQRLGSSIDQALLNMGVRVKSSALDNGLSALLIGRRVGGDLSRVLETTAATLREMRRLQGVLKSKTAEARAQMWTLMLIPPGLVWALEKLMPGYYEPLANALIGRVIIAVSVLLWLLSMVVARRILKVEL